jgi:hypothetical protein
MITGLHSCFIAGLTLVYCLWRDASLFSYQALEAVRACSLCLTIFGEKWPGAVKYRDIFDALSASLFKAIVNPKGGSGESTPAPGQTAEAGEEVEEKRKPLEITIHRDQRSSLDVGPYPTEVSQDFNAQDNMTTISPNTMVLGAVKEAFMEVDEEAPGGWQGWRMFSEMVQQGGEAQGLSVDPASLQQTDDTAMRWDDDVQFADGDFEDADFQMIDGFTSAELPQSWN